jgi:hypothetical protein
MTLPQKFCTACGTPFAAGMKFCSQCGKPVPVTADVPLPEMRQAAGPAPTAYGGRVRILGIVPFLEQGLLSVIHYTLIVTVRRLIFCTWNPDTDEAMSDADDTVMQESCSISETTDEIAHFRAKDWSAGPWQRYLSMDPDVIITGAPGTLVVSLQDITTADIICETKKIHAGQTVSPGSRPCMGIRSYVFAGAVSLPNP